MAASSRSLVDESDPRAASLTIRPILLPPAAASSTLFSRLPGPLTRRKDLACSFGKIVEFERFLSDEECEYR